MPITWFSIKGEIDDKRGSNKEAHIIRNCKNKQKTITKQAITFIDNIITELSTVSRSTAFNLYTRHSRSQGNKFDVRQHDESHATEGRRSIEPTSEPHFNVE
jgi:hypothetical protein